MQKIKKNKDNNLLTSSTFRSDLYIRMVCDFTIIKRALISVFCWEGHFVIRFQLGNE